MQVLPCLRPDYIHQSFCHLSLDLSLGRFLYQTRSAVFPADSEMISRHPAGTVLKKPGTAFGAWDCSTEGTGREGGRSCCWALPWGFAAVPLLVLLSGAGDVPCTFLNSNFYGKLKTKLSFLGRFHRSEQMDFNSCAARKIKSTLFLCYFNENKLRHIKKQAHSADF